jgi:hypothetical protein
MTDDEIVRMAREAGLVFGRAFALTHLRDFAALVVAAERGMADERARLRSLYESNMAPATLIDPRGSLGEPIV